MKKTLGRLWKFANTPVEKILSWDTVKGGVDGAKAVFLLAKTLKDEASNDQNIAKLVNQTSTLLDILNSPWGQVISRSLPFVSIGVNLLQFYLKFTQQEPPLSQSVALVTQAAYLASLQNYFDQHSDLKEKLEADNQNASELVTKEINDLADLELTDYQARFALVYFAESELAQAFNEVLALRLQETGVSKEKAEIIVNNIAVETSRFIEQTLAEGAESIQKLKEWYSLGGKEVFERNVSIDNYLEEKIASLPQQNVFNEEFTFQDIYIPLKATLLDANGKEINKYETFLLQDWVKERILDSENKDKVIVIQAGPGRGKSVFCRMFANQVYRELHPSLTPIFIRLRDIDVFEQNFQETLKNALSNVDFVNTDNGWLTDRNTHYLFFLDGFDELRLEGRSRVGLDRFLQQIATFQQNMQTKETGHRVILTGRAIAFAGISLPANLTQVKILTMDSDLQAQWLEKWEKVVDKNPEIARRKTQSFREFLEADNCPEEVKEELAVEPLLLYLLAAMHRDGKLTLEDFQNESKVEAKITIYEQSLEWVLTKQRDKYLQARITGLHKDSFKDNMELILTESALAVVQSGGESAQLKMIKQRLNKEDADLVEIIEQLQEKEGNKALNTTLGAFYIKATDNQKGSVEFYHKSFSEFLCAKRLQRSLEEWTEKKGRRNRWTVNDEQLASQIYDLLGYGGLTVEIVEYLFGLLKKSDSFPYVDLFERLESFYCSWCDGEFIDAEGTTLPQIKMRELNSFISQEKYLGQRQVDIFTGLNAMILLFELHRYGQNSQNEELKQQLNFHCCGKFDAHGKLKNPDLLLRLIGYSCCLKNDAFIQIVGKFLFFVNFQDVNLQRTKLQDANFQGTYFQGANLQRTNFQGANLQNTNFQNAYLQGAYLYGAYLQNANLYGAYLQNANLYSANLSGAYLQNANLSGVNLSGANLSGANLQRANLQRANLSAVNLSGANLSDVNLTSKQIKSAHHWKKAYYALNYDYESQKWIIDEEKQNAKIKELEEFIE